MPSIVCLLLAALLGGCSTEWVYNSAQQMQLQECRKIPDRDESQRCEQRNSTRYETYKAQSAAAAKP